jgi:hypothetical protein
VRRINLGQSLPWVEILPIPPGAGICYTSPLSHFGGRRSFGDLGGNHGSIRCRGRHRLGRAVCRGRNYAITMCGWRPE